MRNTFWHSKVERASLFGEEWEPDDIVREIEADENFRIRIINEDEEIPDEYEDWYLILHNYEVDRIQAEAGFRKGFFDSSLVSL